MKTIEIAINKDRVFVEVAKATAYTGVKTVADDPGGQFDRVATVDEDAEMLARYWDDAATSLIDELKSFVVALRADSGSLGLTLEVSGFFDDTLAPTVENSIFSWFTAMLTYRWLQLALPPKAEEWRVEADRLLGAILRALYHRRAPRRPLT